MSQTPQQYCSKSMQQLANQIKSWGKELGFQQLGITDTQLGVAEARLQQWLDQGMQGSMEYMSKHGRKRSRPEQLIPGTIRIISIRMDYYPPDSHDPWQVLGDPERAYISRYALGRDYHKVLRKRLQQLAEKISAHIGEFGYRAFVDSAPVLEKALAEKAGLGWIGKHSNLLSRDAGSWYFLGELYTDLPLPVDQTAVAHCGSCRACIDVCPTAAIIEPYVVDARRCISYHTIELKGPIPEKYRKAMGNRIYGCDDCQLVCPWNRFAKASHEVDFAVRHQLDGPSLVSLFSWDETTFLQRTEGSAIRRIGYERWLRNIAVALGNAPSQPDIIQALLSRKEDASALIREHVHWALAQHGAG